MTTYKVAELEGALLDTAVAKAAGKRFTVRNGRPAVSKHFDPEGPAHEFDYEQFKMYSYLLYSTDWSDGGPIIDRERINVVEIRKGEWWAEPTAESFRSLEGVLVGASSKGEGGPTPLIAAMRAYVSSKFGETVELP